MARQHISSHRVTEQTARAVHRDCDREHFSLGVVGRILRRSPRFLALVYASCIIPEIVYTMKFTLEIRFT